MTHLEDSVLVASVVKPVIFKRFVDDIFAVIPGPQVHLLDTLLSDLNSFHANIKFTVEREMDSSLPFLDVLIVKSGDGALNTEVYRKPTHTNQYLNYSSNHPTFVKQGIVKCLKSRAVAISSNKRLLDKEISVLHKAFRSNGYPTDVLDRLLLSESHKTRLGGESSSSQTRPFTTITLEYVPNFSEKIRRVLADFNVRTVFKSSTTLRSLLCQTKPNDSLQRSKEVVYSLPCQCSDIYIGETGRPLAVRIKEHKDNVSRRKVFSSLVAEHAVSNGHHFDWESAACLYKESNPKKRKFIESAFIACGNNIVSQSSMFFPESWHTLLKPAIREIMDRHKTFVTK